MSEKKLTIKNILIANDFFTKPADFKPADLKNFNILFQFEIGYSNEDGGELFDLNISNNCNYKKTVYKYDSVKIKQGCLEIKEYNYHEIIKALEKYLEKINGKRWDDSLKELLKIFRWEYENYEQS